MLCCVGLFGGLYVGQTLGGPWTVVAPAAGFGLGLIGDMKYMRHMHGGPRQQPDDTNQRRPAREEVAVHELPPGDDIQTSTRTHPAREVEIPHGIRQR